MLRLSRGSQQNRATRCLALGNSRRGHAVRRELHRLRAAGCDDPRLRAGDADASRLPRPHLRHHHRLGSRRYSRGPGEAPAGHGGRDSLPPGQPAQLRRRPAAHVEGHYPGVRRSLSHRGRQRLDIDPCLVAAAESAVEPLRGRGITSRKAPGGSSRALPAASRPGMRSFWRTRLHAGVLLRLHRTSGGHGSHVLQR